MILTDGFALRGEELGLDDAETIKQRGCDLIDRAEGCVHADFGDLVKANSVTVAVMMVWYRHALLQQKSIVFARLSSQLRDIIAFSGLSGVLVEAD